MAYGYKTYKTFKEFKTEYIKEAEQSIIVTEYSTNKGFDAKIAALMKDGFKSNPTKMFIEMNKYLRDIVRDDWKIKILSYQEEQETYLATLHAVEALGIKYIPTIYSYETDDISNALNSSALGYGNNINIFLSGYLFSKVLRGIKEKEFVVGHELGHVQNNSVARHIVGVETTNDITRLGEYTADRAGLLACKDVEAAARALLKVSTTVDVSEEQIKLAAHNLVEHVEEKLLDLPGDNGTHPCLERRVAAIKAFASSQMYARLTKNPADGDMLSDRALEKRMAEIIKGGE